MGRDRSTTIRHRSRMTTNKRQEPSSSSSSSSSTEKNNVSSRTSFLLYLLVLLTVALFLSYFHFSYIYTLFENDKHFSHLSTLERELSFRTEMGLYYSYFKQIAIDSPSFVQGFLSIIRDNRTEAPTTINVLERFNLYPELLLGFLYRQINAQGWLKEICYRIDRGQTMSAVISCEGHKEPTYFYVTCVFILNGLILGILFLFGTYLSKSVFGGILTTFAYVFNHSEATRIMWTPPLRESFAFPFHIVQMFVITYVLQQQHVFDIARAFQVSNLWRKKFDEPQSILLEQNLESRSSKIPLVLLLSASTILYILPWQFAQFTLATQLLSLGLLYLLNLLPVDKFFFILCVQTLSLTLSAVFMFGNRMLLTSLFSITLFTFYSVYFLDNSFSLRPTNRWLIIFRRTILFLISFTFTKLILINQLLSSPDDDAHIWDILKSKFSSTFRTFDTQLYTCAKEFDFLEFETVIKLCKTGLLPLSALVILRLCVDFLLAIFGREQEVKQLTNYYHLIQTGVYTLMALLIMRLKLFLISHLCLLLSLIMCENLWPKKIIKMKKWKFVMCILLVIGMGVQGRKNIKEQLNIKGEYSNYPMEQMVLWINSNTPNESIFAGTMPTMANLKLSTRRPIVVHPHYEHGKIRRRVKLVYTMFSRYPLAHVHSILTRLHVDYYVYESHWCTITNRPRGCSFPEMYDLDENDQRILQRDTLACHTLQSQPEPYFKQVFQYDYLSIYAVL